MPKLIAFFLSILLLGMSTSQSGAPPAVPRQPGEVQQDQPYETHNFYYNGEKWTPSWFQCDGPSEVSVFEKPSDTEAQVLLKFAKLQPIHKREVKLLRAGEPDCGMMKCWWSFKAVTEDRSTLAVQESHYLDLEEGFWTNQYRLGAGVNLEAAQAHLTQCRWLPRLRLAAITDRQSIYINATKSGDLVLKAFAYSRSGSRPSLSLSNGLATVDKEKAIETFSFGLKPQNYIIAVSTDEQNPKINIQLPAPGEAGRKANCLSYTYVKKP